MQYGQVFHNLFHVPARKVKLRGKMQSKCKLNISSTTLGMKVVRTQKGELREIKLITNHLGKNSPKNFLNNRPRCKMKKVPRRKITRAESHFRSVICALC